MPWSSILQSENELKSLIENVAQILMPPSNILQEPRIVTLAAAQLILTVSSQIRPRYMLDCPAIKQLIQIGSNLTYLDKQAAALIRNAIVNCFVLPWPNTPSAEQELERRSFMLHSYIHNLAQDLMNLDVTPSTGHSQQEKIAKVITNVLPVLSEIIEYNRESSSSVKHMLVGAFRTIIEKSLQLFGHFGGLNEDVANCVLSFALCVIETLQIQLGSPSIRDMLVVFLSTTTK